MIEAILILLAVWIIFKIYKHKLSREDRVAHLPRIRATYKGFEAVYSVDGKIVFGQMPKKQSRKISAWILRHRYTLENGEMPKGKLPKDFEIKF